jgi:23S rRNA (uracil1939-C5)-methyltransferase
MKPGNKPVFHFFGPEVITGLHIESLAFNGYGVGRLNGRVVFVPRTAPGDEIECRVVRERKNCLFAELIRLLKTSPERREPLCPAFGSCGGCQWQHLPYAVQTHWKDFIFRQMLQRQHRVAEEAFAPLAASPEAFHYRSRAQFKCRHTDQGLVMGFYRQGSHYVVDIPECPLVAEEINVVFQRFRSCLRNSPGADRIPQIDISVDEKQKVRVVVHVLGGIGEKLAACLRPEAEKKNLNLFFQSGRNHTLRKICGTESLHLFPCGPEEGISLAYGPGSFSQINLEQNRRLVSAVMDFASLRGNESVLDLFCGVGNLSLPLARKAGRVVGVENYTPAVVQAKRNAAANGIENTRFRACPAEAAFLKSEGVDEHFDVVVLDPPRDGAYQVAKGLVRSSPKKIIYVSCNPATLTRDLGPLLHHGYRISRCRVYDFFPQTYHIESLTLLEKN